MTQQHAVDESGAALLPRGAQRAGRITFFLGLGVAVASMALLLFADLPSLTSGVLVIALSVVLILLGIPVGVAMLGASLLGLWEIGGIRVVIGTMEAAAYSATDSWSFSVIPMFILMGMLLWKSGLTASAFEAARQWVGWMPGGLAVATNFAGAGLAAGSGSTIGITYALGRVSVPEMIRSGYRPSLAVGTVAAAGTLGQIIPPSLLLVIYAGAASVPVGPQLLAGIVPGIVLALAFAVMIVARASLNPKLAPRADMTGVTWGTRMRSLVGIVPIVLVVLVVIGGLFAGLFTATESAVFGMLVALIFGVAHKLRLTRSWRQVGTMLREAVLGVLTGTASIFLLLLGVEVLTRAIALSQVANVLATSVSDLGLGRVAFLLVLIVVYIILGMFMDTLAMMLLTIPVLLAPLAAVGVDPLWFGVFLVIMAEVGLLTPPLGILSFIVHRITQDPAVNLGSTVSLVEVFKGVAWFAAVAVAVVVLLILVPELATWLPSVSVAT
ncbi:MAG: TRAP transporter large permease subunit [Salinibacterium sp.]|nr:TRAP transporter large permease subunit [Salinibacterium sp.]MBF0673346.1 TRAP transporter large permease subunit [Salinibacterium sp.]